MCFWGSPFTPLRVSVIQKGRPCSESTSGTKRSVLSPLFPGISDARSRMFQAPPGAVPKPQAGRALCFVPTPPPGGGEHPPPPQADVTHTMSKKSVCRAMGSPPARPQPGAGRSPRGRLVLVFISRDVCKDFKRLPPKELFLICGPRLKAE